MNINYEWQRITKTCKPEDDRIVLFLKEHVVEDIYMLGFWDGEKPAGLSGDEFLVAYFHPSTDCMETGWETPTYFKYLDKP
jgi:hypothetical protein